MTDTNPAGELSKNQLKKLQKKAEKAAKKSGDTPPPPPAATSNASTNISGKHVPKKPSGATTTTTTTVTATGSLSKSKAPKLPLVFKIGNIVGTSNHHRRRRLCHP